MKQWPAAEIFLRAHLPPLQDPPPADSFMHASSRSWWGGAQRSKELADSTKQEALHAAKILGLNAVFDRCVTLETTPSFLSTGLLYHPLSLRHIALPVRLDVETTAPKDAYVLIGIDSQNGVELAMGEDDGKHAAVRWIRSSPGWATRGDLYSVPISAQRQRVEGSAWAKFSIHIQENGHMEVHHHNVHWGTYIPEELLKFIKHRALSVSVATVGAEAKWAVCSTS